ncbi:MAG: reverse transcriptase domain-containing protein, partial [Thermococcus sp.]
THGPFREPPFHPCHTSPIGIVDKPDGSHRLILDLSNRRAGSVNAGIDIEDFPVSYCSFDDAVSLLLDAGPLPFMAKVDIRHAFRLCPVRPAEWPLLCFRWEGLYYFDSRLPFGLRSSPFIFNSFADALLWTLSHHLRLRAVIHYLDDFFLCHSSFRACQTAMDGLLALFTRLGVPLASEKICGPATRLTFLGIEIDTAARTVRLPPDKFAALLQLLTTWRDKTRCDKRALLSLVGRLSFAAKVVKPGRLFLRRLIDLSTTVSRLHHRIHLSLEAKEDILWWLTFLPSWNGVAYIQDRPVSSADLHLFTDASALGIGGVFGDSWFSTPLEAFRTAPWFPPPEEPFDINFWELLALVTAFFTWAPHFRDLQVVIHTDNMPLVHVWSRGSRNVRLMRLIRPLFLRSAQSNTNLLLLHIPGHSNVLADLLSRLQVRRFHEAHPTASPSPSPPPPDLWQL